MAKFFGNLNAVLGAGVVLLIILMFALHGNVMDAIYWNVWFRFVHVLCGIMWIGLLYYFNFVQTPTMPSIPAELKPGVTKYIAPRALFWFRWGALATVLTGATVAGMPGPNGPYLVEALTFHAGSRVIGTGMWLALIMAFNVWFLIWPAQKKVLGLVEADADAKAKAATTGLVFSRINVLLSIPMLYCMVTQFYLPR
ncbi:MAG: urate hydroxylase PuuD [Sphingomonadaceae bacterium]|nr:urate hydroxylase PuuD [Sphingomonadaceae bacterium]